LFTRCQSFPNFCHHQIIAIITTLSPESLDIKYSWVSCPIHQNTVNCTASLSVRRCRSNCMNKYWLNW
jgi:hypothetical protein